MSFRQSGGLLLTALWLLAVSGAHAASSNRPKLKRIQSLDPFFRTSAGAVQKNTAKTLTAVREKLRSQPWSQTKAQLGQLLRQNGLAREAKKLARLTKNSYDKGVLEVAARLAQMGKLPPHVTIASLTVLTVFAIMAVTSMTLHDALGLIAYDQTHTIPPEQQGARDFETFLEQNPYQDLDKNQTAINQVLAEKQHLLTQKDTLETITSQMREVGGDMKDRGASPFEVFKHVFNTDYAKQIGNITLLRDHPLDLAVLQAMLNNGIEGRSLTDGLGSAPEIKRTLVDQWKTGVEELAGFEWLVKASKK